MGITKQAGTVRERLLRSANALFYREGIHVVGIERILTHAGVAKASLYDTFKNKDELVRAYLEGRASALQLRIKARIATTKGGREAILAVFDDFVDRVTGSEDYFGCPFISACAEGGEKGSVAREVSLAHRRWQRELFTTLAKQARLENAEELGRQLCFLYDGAAVAAAMEGDREDARAVRKAAEALLP